MSRQRMGQGYSQRTQARQKTQISPVVMQGLEVLALPVTSLEEYVRSCAESNPMLELEFKQEGLSFDEIELWNSRPASPEASESRYGARRFSSIAGYTETDFGRLADACMETESLQSYLRMQLNSSSVEDEHDRAFIDRLIECIDDNGYFAGNLRQLAREAGILYDDAEALLKRLQRFNPRGVGARSIAECLILQLPDDFRYELIATILRESMDDFASNRTAKLMRDYGLNRDGLRRVKECVAKLDPRPGASFSQGNATVYVIPDLSVRSREGSFEIEVTGLVGTSLVLNREYLELMGSEGLGQETLEWLKSCKVDAANVMRNLKQRNRTLYRLGMYLVKAQYDFFRSGPDRLRPLTMQQAADALDVHVSTVSRTVQDKHMLTPWGCYPLKFFFCSQLPSSGPLGGSVCSSQSVKAQIKKIIDAEDPASPYSDAQITKMLNAEGVEVKRRTVAKYREALSIPCQSRRRF